MNIKPVVAIAFATLLAAGSGALAATQHDQHQNHHHRILAEQQPHDSSYGIYGLYGDHNESYLPTQPGIYDSEPDIYQTLDPAKGSLW